MLVRHHLLVERRPSWMISRGSRFVGRESSKGEVAFLPEPDEDNTATSSVSWSSASGGGSPDSSSCDSSTGSDGDGEEIDVDAALTSGSEATACSWTPVKMVVPELSAEERHSSNKKQRRQQPLVVSTHRLTSIPECSQEDSKEAAANSFQELARRVEALEVGAAYRATKSEVEKIEEELLVKLRAIRESMADTGDSAGASADVTIASSKELEALRAENDQLKQRNAKLEYRVQHVVGEMTRLYGQVVELKQNANDSGLAEF
jgi:FtsZ-binding cell division protein ZapB